MMRQCLVFATYCKRLREQGGFALSANKVLHICDKFVYVLLHKNSKKTMKPHYNNVGTEIAIKKGEIKKLCRGK
jgi:hypothetical protein